MTKLDFLNRFILQWFFIRLVRNVERIRITTDVDADLNWLLSPYEQVTRWWSIMAWVVPTTGYGNAFRYIGRRRWCPRYWRVSRFTVSIEGPPPPEGWNCRCTIIESNINGPRSVGWEVKPPDNE